MGKVYEKLGMLKKIVQCFNFRAIIKYFMSDNLQNKIKPKFLPLSKCNKTEKLAQLLLVAIHPIKNYEEILNFQLKLFPL